MRNLALLFIVIVSCYVTDVTAQYNLKVIASTAMAAPGTNNEKYGYFNCENSYITDDNRIIFESFLGTIMNPSPNKRGLWIEENGESKLLAREGYEVKYNPGVKFFYTDLKILFAVRPASDGSIMIASTVKSNVIKDPYNDALFVYKDNQMKLVSHAYQTIGDITFLDFISFGSSNITYNSGRASFILKEQIPSIARCLVLTGNNIQNSIILSRKDETAPNHPDLEIDGFSDARINNKGDVLYFVDGDLNTKLKYSAFMLVKRTAGGTEQVLEDFDDYDWGTQYRINTASLRFNNNGEYSFAGVLPPDDKKNGIWLKKDGSLKMVFDFGATLPGSASILTSRYDYVLMDDGIIYLYGLLKDDNNGIWKIDPNGKIEKIVMSGDTAHGLNKNLKFKSIGKLSVNSEGTLLYTGSLNGPGVIDFFNDDAIWVYEGGSHSLVLRKGDSLEFTPGKKYQIDRINLKTSQFSESNTSQYLYVADGPGNDGLDITLNKNGEFVFEATATINFKTEEQIRALVHASKGIIVNTTNDLPDTDPGDGKANTGGPMIDGRYECSLRAALMESNAKPGTDKISFKFKESGPYIIKPESELPAVSDKLTIEGIKSSINGEPNVVIDGSKLQVEIDGISVIKNGRLSVSNLSVINFKGSGVSIDDQDSNIVDNCWIGISVSEPSNDIYGNGKDGINIVNSSFNNIRNCNIGNNKGNGISISGGQSKENIIYRNVIGGLLDNESIISGGNGNNGVELSGGTSKNYIGLSIIINNKSNGVSISGKNQNMTKENRIVDNMIGCFYSELGFGEFPNEKNGIMIDNSMENTIGESFEINLPFSNIISSNKESGIFINGELSSKNKINSNYIGTDHKGKEVKGNDNGIVIMNAPENYIGEPDGYETQKLKGNLISGNTQDGIRIEGITATGNEILGNLIGLDREGSNAIPNLYGISIIDAPANYIGGSSMVPGKNYGNIVSGNKLIQIKIYEKNAKGNIVHSNIIGLNVHGNAIPVFKGAIRQRIGIDIKDSPDNQIGGDSFENHNIISGMTYLGIYISGNYSMGNKIAFNYLGLSKNGIDFIPNLHSIRMMGVSGNLIGSDIIPEDSSLFYNVIADDIEINNSEYINIYRNLIGMNIDRKENLNQNKYEKSALSLNSSHRIFIGDTNNKVSNIIGSVLNYGIIIISGGSNKIWNNFIGIDDLSRESSLIKKTAIELIDTRDNEIGGFSPKQKNIIVSETVGIFITSVSLFNKIINNQIGYTDKNNKKLGGAYGIINESDETEIRNNIILFQDSSAIRSRASMPHFGMEMSRNLVMHNNIGLKILFSQPNLSHHNIKIMNNYFVMNNKGIELGRYEDTISDDNIVLQGNFVQNNLGTNTGISIENLNPVLIGNSISKDVGNAVRISGKSNPRITQNEIFDNSGFGILNENPDNNVQARQNWWGHVSGPSGSASGEGDRVSDYVDYSDWLTKPFGLKLTAANDTIFVPSGKKDTLLLSVVNRILKNDEVNIALSDSKNWIKTKNLPNIVLDSMGAIVDVAIDIPAGEGESYSILKAVCKSKKDNNLSDTLEIVMASYTPELNRIYILQDSISLVMGESYQFLQKGYDNNFNSIDYSPNWTSTGGTIDNNGLFYSGSSEGMFIVKASNQSGTVFDECTVVVMGANSIENDRNEKLKNNPVIVNDKLKILYIDNDLLIGNDAKIYSITGQLVKSYSLSNKIDVSDLNMGMYFIKIGSGYYKFLISYK